MFGIGSMELVVIFIVALLVLGPKNLPKIAHTLGRALGQFRRISTEFQRTLNTEIAFEEEKEKSAKAKENESEKLFKENSPLDDLNDINDDTNSLNKNQDQPLSTQNKEEIQQKSVEVSNNA